MILKWFDMLKLQLYELSIMPKRGRLLDFDPLIPNFDIIHNSTMFIQCMINLIFELSKISGTIIKPYTLGSNCLEHKKSTKVEF